MQGISAFGCESPEGTNINNRGLSAATRSETHGAQKVLHPTLKGLNLLERSADAFCSTPSGSGLPDITSPRVAQLRHLGLLMLVPFRDSQALPPSSLSSEKDVGHDRPIEDGNYLIWRLGRTVGQKHSLVCAETILVPAGECFARSNFQEDPHGVRHDTDA